MMAENGDAGKENGMKTLLISACLLGVRCRYDGGSKPQPGVEELAGRYRLIPVCPNGRPILPPSTRIVLPWTCWAALAGRVCDPFTKKGGKLFIFPKG